MKNFEDSHWKKLNHRNNKAGTTFYYECQSCPKRLHLIAYANSLECALFVEDIAHSHESLLQHTKFKSIPAKTRMKILELKADGYKPKMISAWLTVNLNEGYVELDKRQIVSLCYKERKKLQRIHYIEEQMRICRESYARLKKEKEKIEAQLN